MNEVDIAIRGTNTLQADLGNPVGYCDVTAYDVIPPKPGILVTVVPTVATQPELDDVTIGVPPSAITSPRNVDTDFVPPPSDFSPTVGEFLPPASVPSCSLEFRGLPPIHVYNECAQGNCDCLHFIGGKPAQLKPCRAAQFLFGQNALDSIPECERDYLWNGLVEGFRIADADCSASYSCINYDSITSDEYRDEMSALLRKELDMHKVSEATTPPQCIHALGAVTKANGHLRPITDCSRPDGSSINNFMASTFESFSYNSVETATQVLSPNDYMSVIDISAA